MDHHKNQPRDRKAFYIGPVVIGCALAMIAGFVALRQPMAPKPAPPPAVVQKPAVTAPRATQPPVLGRSGMVSHAAEVTDYFAATGQLPAGKDGFVGRRFQLLIPFGCNGANGAPVSPHTSVVYEAAQARLSLTAQPGIWTNLPLVQPLVDAGTVEAAEGFWLPRPWTGSEECPPPATGILPPIVTPATAQTLGLAQLLLPGAARTLRHAQHPYSVVRKVPPTDIEELNRSYHLVLEGTITGFPDGRALHCWAEAADHQPICIYAVTFDRVTFRDASNGTILGSWTD